MSARLSPATRDRFLLVCEMLLSGAVRLDGRVAVLGHSVHPLQLLIEVAASGSGLRFPGITAEAVNKAVGTPVDCTSYSSCAATLLLHFPRVELVRAEALELANAQLDEIKLEAAAERAKAESAARKAGREARREAAGLAAAS